MITLRFPGGLRKALTLSYDDGVKQDVRMLEILRRHGLKITVNLNSGCMADEEEFNRPDTKNRRMPLSLCQKTYAGDDVEIAVHGVTHPSLPELSQEQMDYEVREDRNQLEKMFGGIVRGMAYPYGTYNDQVVSTLEKNGVVYSRTTITTHRFDIPTDWLRLEATCHHNDPELDALCDRFLQMQVDADSQLFYLWGHSYEFDDNDNWQVIERFAEKMGGHEDIWYATNIEIYDYVTAGRQLISRVDGSVLHNPTATKLWLTVDGKEVCIGAGETLHL